MRINKYIVQCTVISLPTENIFSCVDIQLKDGDSSLKIFQAILEKVLENAQELMCNKGLERKLFISDIKITTISLLDSHKIEEDDIRE